jgi:hypothetical protein
MNDEDELRRINDGPRPGENPSGLLADFQVDCEPDAVETLRSAREVLRVALRQPDPGSVTLEQWRHILPAWFVEKCGPEISMEEAVRRRALSMEERARLAETWSLSAWVYWLKPSERQWSWWDANVISRRIIQTRVVVTGFPFPSGSLQWLFKCCGAKSFDLIE